jgi:hypothetical protein
VVLRQYTHKSYDWQQTIAQLRTTAISVAMTLAMYAWRGYKAPLLAACTQPFFMAADPLFQQRVLGMATEVERPAQDPFKKCV